MTTDAGSFETTGTSFVFGGGVIHMLSDTVGLDGEVNYQITNVESETEHCIMTEGPN